jgi:hypothetical protein
VEISGARKDNAYKGTSEHMEYYTGEQKVILNGGAPQLVRTCRQEGSRRSSSSAN